MFRLDSRPIVLHLLLSAANPTLSLKAISRMSDDEAHVAPWGFGSRPTRARLYSRAAAARRCTPTRPGASETARRAPTGSASPRAPSSRRASSPSATPRRCRHLRERGQRRQCPPTRARPERAIQDGVRAGPQAPRSPGLGTIAAGGRRRDIPQPGDRRRAEAVTGPDSHAAADPTHREAEAVAGRDGRATDPGAPAVSAASHAPPVPPHRAPSPGEGQGLMRVLGGFFKGWFGR